jgi:hypothetical protein
MLDPVSSHTAAETRQVVCSLENQPTVAGHSGDHPPDLETLRATPARPHQILIQGNRSRLWNAATPVRKRRESDTDPAFEGTSEAAWSRAVGSAHRR